MAYTGRGFQRTWSYEPSGDDHNARVGRILAGNLDLASSMRSKALAELTAREAALEPAGSAAAADVAGMNTRAFDSRARGSSSQMRGYVWVDTQGNYLGHVGGASCGRAATAPAPGSPGSPGGAGRVLGATAALAAAAAGPGGAGTGRLTHTGGGGAPGTGSSGTGLTGRRLAQLTERQAACAALQPTQRSMELWKRVAPGCVEATTRTPRSTFRAHFGPKAGAEDAEDVDKRYHFQKTDFSEYTEVKLRLMQHLKS